MPNRSQPPRILLIEPDEEQRVEALKCLAQLGLEAQVTEDPDGLRAALASGTSELILVDSTTEAGMVAALKDAVASGVEFSTVCMAPAGKNERRCRARLGRIDVFLTKPFTPETLALALDKWLPAPDEEPRARETPDDRADERALLGWLDGLQLGPFHERPGPRGTVVPALAQLVLTSLRDEFRRALASDEANGASGLQRVAERLLSAAFGLGVARECLHTIDAHLQRDFAASAAIISLADLIQSLANKRLTGVLTVRSENNEIELHIAAGEVFFLNPRKLELKHSAEYVFCNFQAFPRRYIERLLEESRRDGDSIFFFLLRDQVLEQEALSETMVAFGFEVLRECMLEQDTCWYQFHNREAPEALYMEHGVAMSAQSLMLKVTSDLDEWKAMQEDVHGVGVEFERIRELDDWEMESLGAKQRAVLRALEESASVLDLAATCRLSPFEVCKELHRLMMIELVRRIQVQELDLAGS